MVKVAVFWTGHTDALHLKRLVSRASFTRFSGSIVEQSWLAYWALLGWLVPELGSLTGQALDSITVRPLLWTHALTSHLSSIYRANKSYWFFADLRSGIPHTPSKAPKAQQTFLIIMSILRAFLTLPIFLNGLIFRTGFTSFMFLVVDFPICTFFTPLEIIVPMLGE